MTTREVECAKQNSVACFVCHLERRHKYVLITVFLNRVVLSKLQSLLRNGHQNTVESASLAGKWHGCSAGKQSFSSRWLRKPLQTRLTWMLVIVSNDCLWALPPLWNKHFVRRKKNGVTKPIQPLHRYNPPCTELLVQKTTYPAMPYHTWGNEAICPVGHTELQWPRLSSQASLLCPLWIVLGPRFVHISLLRSFPDRCWERKGKKTKYILSSTYSLMKVNSWSSTKQTI